MTTLKTNDLKFEIPKRHHCNEKRELTSIRIPADLKRELEKTAKSLGWDTSDVMVTALDQFVHWANKRDRRI